MYCKLQPGWAGIGRTHNLVIMVSVVLGTTSLGRTDTSVWTAELPTAVSVVRMSADGSICLTVESTPDQELANSSSSVNVWDLNNKSKLAMSGVTFTVSDASISNDGQTVAIAGKHLGHPSQRPEVGIWDAATGKLKKTLVAPGQVRCLSFAPNGKILATGELITDLAEATRRKAQVKTWDPITGKLLRRVDCATLAVSKIVFTSDSRVFCGHGGIEVAHWTNSAERIPLSKTMISPWHFRELEVHCFEFAPDTTRLVAVLEDAAPSSARECQVRTWNAGFDERQVSLVGVQHIAHAVLSRDTALLAARKVDRNDPPTKLMLWDTTTGLLHCELEQSDTRIDCLAFSKSGRQVVAATTPQGNNLPIQIHSWSVDDGKRLGSVDVPSGRITTMEFTPDDRQLVCGGSSGIGPHATGLFAVVDTT